MGHEKSRSLFEHAVEVIPGGVNSPVRACKSVGWIAYFTYFWGFFLYWGLGAIIHSVSQISN